MVLYLLFAAASHIIPLEPGLEPALAVAPWLLFGGLGALIRFGRPRLPAIVGWRELLRSWPLTAVFAITAAVAFAVAFSGNLPVDCPTGSRVCVEIDEWSSGDGQYYRHHPYDASGRFDPGQPWVEISQQTYIGEVGTLLRQAAGFGILGLFVAWVAVTGLSQSVDRKAA